MGSSTLSVVVYFILAYLQLNFKANVRGFYLSPLNSGLYASLATRTRLPSNCLPLWLQRNEFGTFADVEFPPPISTALRKMHILRTPSPIQSVAIPQLCDGLSALLHAPTGTGKTYAYLLPALKKLFEKNELEKPLQILIVVPTRELVDQVKEDVQRLTNYHDGLSIFYCRNTISKEELQQRLISPLWIGTSYQLSELLEKKLVGNLLRNIEFLIFDEVDRLVYAPSKYITLEEKEKHLEVKEIPTLNIINSLIKSKVVLQDDPKKLTNPAEPKFFIDKFQVIGASATVGRPLRRKFFQLFNVQSLDDVTSSEKRPYGGSFPVLRPAGGVDTWKEGQHTGERIDHGFAVGPITEEDNISSNRFVTIPKEIQHYLLVDHSDIDDFVPDEVRKQGDKTPARGLKAIQSQREAVKPKLKPLNYREREEAKLQARLKPFKVSAKLGLIHKEYLRKYPDKWSKALVFVPELNDVVEALFILRKWKAGKVSSLAPLLTRLQCSPDPKIANANLTSFFPTNLSLGSPSLSHDKCEKELIIIPFSGTRGLHIPNIDTVFILRPPKTMDEYLHIAGRTGRLDCNFHWSKSGLSNSNRGENFNNKVITVVSARNLKRVQSWQEPLKFQFQLISNEGESIDSKQTRTK
jgi:superfamily II DNA/RNA helicase